LSAFFSLTHPSVSDPEFDNDSLALILVYAQGNEAIQHLVKACCFLTPDVLFPYLGMLEAFGGEP
jgi:hypothetical protein